MVGDNPERLDSEESFAALCGVSPVERSSGRRQFRRPAHPGLLRAPDQGGARPGAKSSVASNATPPGRFSTWSNSYSQHPAHRGCDRNGAAEPPLARLHLAGLRDVMGWSVC
ncbi:transposase [Streptomyces sp. ME18-1-4]|uniref:transposase n=1 Tax=Streptomyces sp. ME18-1-4 TaxID=3028685 RepID=UPI0029B56A44|nr:transposase [Streptomyces sp. ME18-1-4]MDX3246499.1 transposase [Streptomyces sp. ME18-1-4]